MTPTKKLFFLILCLAVGQVLIAQTTYTSVQNGNWNVASTWDANGIPPNTIPANATVEIKHNVAEAFTAGLPKTNNGTININADAILVIYHDFDNYGTIETKGGPIYSEFRIVITSFNNKAGGVLKSSGANASVSLWSDATLNNEAGGLVDMTRIFVTLQGANSLNNAGIINLRPSYSTGHVSYGPVINSAGAEFNVYGRFTVINNTFTNGGALKLFDNYFSVQGTFSSLAGSSIDWVLPASGTLGTDYPSFIHSSGPSTYTGSTFTVSLASGFEPSGGDQFTILREIGFPIPTNPISLPALTGGKTWTVTRNSSQVILKVEEDSCEPTPISCPSNIVQSNDAGECGATVSFSLPDGATATPPSGSFFPVGTTTVDVEGSDGCDGTSTCSFTVTVNDTEKPSISCPSNTTEYTDYGQCGADVDLPAPNASDNCGVTELKGRYRLVDEDGDPLGSYTSRTNDPSDYLAVGRYQVNWRAKDAAGEKRSCSYYVTVEDDEDPTAVCKDVTVDFNGQSDVNLSVSQVWNESASDDNCGTLYYVGTSPSLSISCEDVGNSFPLTVTIRDEAGNKDQCTATVNVIGLACGWSEGANDGSLNCGSNTSATYDPIDESFDLTANGCWHDCLAPDKAAHVYQLLCGDGQLTARLASINSKGYAGLMARESLDPESRRAGVLKNNSTRRVRREYRASNGGAVTQRPSNRSRVEWLRIVRQGTKIKSYTSTNGSSWRLLYQVTFPSLADCIYVDMMAYSLSGSAEVEATFDQVSITGGGSSYIDDTTLPGSFTQLDTDIELGQAELNIFPNPSSGVSQLELNGFADVPAQIWVRDAFGKVVRQIELDAPQAAVLSLDLTGLPAGLYLITAMQDQQEVVTKKLVLQR